MLILASTPEVAETAAGVDLTLVSVAVVLLAIAIGGFFMFRIMGADLEAPFAEFKPDTPVFLIG